MELKRYIATYDTLSKKKMTEEFNKLEVSDRIKFMKTLAPDDKRKFIKDIRKQAVLDFWTHEKENIKNGTCTRAWTPEQIEVIMHISEKSGKELKNGAIAYFGEQAA